MCETNVYVLKDGVEELFLDNASVVRPEEGTVFVKNLFGEQKVFEGRIREILLSKHKIILEK